MAVIVECVPTVRPVVTHVATPAETGEFAQPDIVTPPSLKVTSPVTEPGDTFAVRVTVAPWITGVAGDTLMVVVVSLLTLKAAIWPCQPTIEAEPVIGSEVELFAALVFRSTDCEATL